MMNKKYTILIVEDEIELRKLFSEKLQNEGFNVLEAENGKIGLEIALAKHPDMILLDIIMPVMGGLATLKELQNNAWGRVVPIIILSNLSESENIGESLERNVCGYFVKSDWEPDALVALIEKSLIKNK